MKNKRECWLDALRGFAMLLVIWGHCQRQFFYNAIYCVNVPLFVIVSGCLYGKKEFMERGIDTNYIKKIINNHLYPYISYGVLFVFVKYANYLLGIKSFGMLETANFKELLLVFVRCEAGTNWFFVPLVLAELLFLLLIKIINKIDFNNTKNLSIRCLIIMAIGFLGVKLFLGVGIDSLIVSNGDFSSCVLSWSIKIIQAMAFLYFLALGYLLYYWTKKKSNPILLKVVVSFGLIFFFFMNYNAEESYFCEVRWLNLDSVNRFFLMSSILSISIVGLFSIFQNHSRIIQYVGKNTLIINGTHLTLGVLDLVTCWYYRWSFSAYHPMLNSIVVATITCFFEISLIVPVFNSSLRFMNKKSELERSVRNNIKKICAGFVE